MKLHINFSPPNSIIFVMGATTGIPPESLDRLSVAYTESCVAICTLNSDDGDTGIIMSDSLQDRSFKMQHLIFEGSLTVPEREISVLSSFNEILLTLPVTSEFVSIRVFINRIEEPDLVGIFIL